MIPRKRIDIGLSDIALGLLGCFLPINPATISRDIELQWDPRAIRSNLVCLSVRSGFDAFLSALQLPAGSEVLMSAVNIADMVRIAEAHGLVVVPVDVDPQTLEVAPEALARAWSPKARIVLVAHLFGVRAPLGAVSDFCIKNNMLLVEDCAQAYTGDSWRGDDASDITLFSFGPVKTATALGGAILCFRDRALLDRTRAQIANWPVQKRVTYAGRLLKYAFILPFGIPAIFGLLAVVCRCFGSSHENIVAGAVKGFSGEEFYAQLRQRPSTPLLILLKARLEQGLSKSALIRAQRADSLRRLLSGHVGENAVTHAHWLFPILHDKREALINHLAIKGFDAALHASSIDVIEAPQGRPRADEMTRIFESLIYVPAHEGMSEADIRRLASDITEFS